jgi:hypothetical protein
MQPSGANSPRAVAARSHIAWAKQSHARRVLAYVASHALFQFLIAVISGLCDVDGGGASHGSKSLDRGTVTDYIDRFELAP